MKEYENKLTYQVVGSGGSQSVGVEIVEGWAHLYGGNGLAGECLDPH